MTTIRTTIRINPINQNHIISPRMDDEKFHELATTLSMNVLFGALAKLPKDDVLLALEQSRTQEISEYLDFISKKYGMESTTVFLHKSMIEGLSKDIMLDLMNQIQYRKTYPI